MTDIGRSPDGSSHSPKGEAASSTASPAKPSVPNAAWENFATIPRDRRVLALCTEDAPFPVMIARWSGESFVSSDEKTSGKKWKVVGWLPLPEPGPIKHPEEYCTFCGKSQHEVAKLIAGPTAMICDECVKLCDDILVAEASAIEAAAAGETTQIGSTEGERAVAESETPRSNTHD